MNILNRRTSLFIEHNQGSNSRLFALKQTYLSLMMIDETKWFYLLTKAEHPSCWFQRLKRQWKCFSIIDLSTRLILVTNWMFRSIYSLSNFTSCVPWSMAKRIRSSSVSNLGGSAGSADVVELNVNTIVHREKLGYFFLLQLIWSFLYHFQWRIIKWEKKYFTHFLLARTTSTLKNRKYSSSLVYSLSIDVGNNEKNTRQCYFYQRLIERRRKKTVESFLESEILKHWKKKKKRSSQVRLLTTTLITTWSESINLFEQQKAQVIVSSMKCQHLRCSMDKKFIVFSIENF